MTIETTGNGEFNAIAMLMMARQMGYEARGERHASRSKQSQ